MNNIIEVSGLTKSFGGKKALQDVSFSAGRGSIIGLMGANGCGKSTLLRNIIGLYLPDAGSSQVFGEQSRELSPQTLSRIGYVHQEGRLLDWMSIRQLLKYVRSYYQSWDEHLEQKFIEWFDLDPKAVVGKLSPGKRQQAAILAAICHNPELLILDEPASALDPLARSRFLDLLLELLQNDGKKTIIISSHILSDIEKVIDRAVIMDSGRILKDCQFDELKEHIFKVILRGGQQAELTSLLAGKTAHRRSDGIKTSLILQDTSRAEVEKILSDGKIDSEIIPLPLEEIYKAVVGKAEYVL
ncbi:ABC transporter ATP-binding protein [Sedimentisphaera salicampi]|uniref:ABC transporter ATP-binding protein n=1 Tax=Sedimentisphaera salicampi TaxID=1941349 RepID=UPI000B9CA1F1|nr:ABC transporter ATP-binding protein [Sedimentisphaera salicampi]OXU14806.1 putative ABC transporter ATP-binding protein YxlF [Sedimentisphaera salicampi]